MTNQSPINRSRSTESSVLIGGIAVHPADSSMLPRKNNDHVFEILIDFNSNYSPDVVYEVLQTIPYFAVKMYI